MTSRESTDKAAALTPTRAAAIFPPTPEERERLNLDPPTLPPGVAARLRELLDGPTE